MATLQYDALVTFFHLPSGRTTRGLLNSLPYYANGVRTDHEAKMIVLGMIDDVRTKFALGTLTSVRLFNGDEKGEYLLGHGLIANSIFSSKIVATPWPKSAKSEPVLQPPDFQG